MCGVCGFVDLQGRPIERSVGKKMMHLLAHRGPDAEGALVMDGEPQQGWSVFLGHTRLKIIDLSEAAAQPLANEDGTVFVVFNGEIYNFRELTSILKKKGHQFRSKSDTEVIVHAYEEFGESFVRYLDGMFAFALLDSRKRRLIVGRDRTGKKPLYYCWDGQRFTFGSEIKTLLACPWVEREMAIEHLPEYLVYGYVPTPRTMYRNVFSLPSASYLVFDEDGIHGPHKYWHLEYPVIGNEAKVTTAEAVERVRQLLTQAVEKRLISDVPLGALLSGGLDSSIIVGIASQILSEPVHTFSVGFDDHSSYDERGFASLVARHFQTRHTEFVVKPDAVGLVERLLWHHDQPYGDSSAIPTFLVSKLARAHVTVVLNGDGGDEVFGGYDRFLAALIASRTPSFAAPIGRFAATFLSKEDSYKSARRRVERFFEQSSQPVDERFLGWIAYFKPDELRTLLNADLAVHLHDDSIRESLRGPLRDSSASALLHQLLYTNFVTYLPDDLHVKMDRMSMANSLETRSPMLDTALIEYVASLPPGLKIHFGQMKYILRRAFSDMLPPSILKRPKHGFGAPLGRWFRSSFLEPFQDTVLSTDARINSYLDRKAVAGILKEHLAGREHGSRLWILFNLELWLRTFEKSADWTPSESLVVEMNQR